MKEEEEENKDRSIPGSCFCNIPPRFVIAMTDSFGIVQKDDIMGKRPVYILVYECYYPN